MNRRRFIIHCFVIKNEIVFFFCFKIIHGSSLHLDETHAPHRGPLDPARSGPPPAASVSSCRTRHPPCAPAPLALSLFLEQAEPLPTSGPPSFLFLLPGTLFPKAVAWLDSLPSDLSLNVTSSERPFLTTLPQPGTAPISVLFIEIARSHNVFIYSLYRLPLVLREHKDLVYFVHSLVLSQYLAHSRHSKQLLSEGVND